MSANSFSPESKKELEVLQFLYNGVEQIKYMNISKDIELTSKQHKKLRNYLDANYSFYFLIMKYTRELYNEVRLSKLNGQPQTIYIITTRTDPLAIRYFSEKYTEERGPYLFIGKKINYSIRADIQDKYSESHPYLFMDNNGVVTDGKQDFFEIFDNGIELDIIPSSSPSNSPSPDLPVVVKVSRKNKTKKISRKTRKTKKTKKSKSTKTTAMIPSPVDVIPYPAKIMHDVAISPMTPIVSDKIVHEEPEPEVVHAIPIMASYVDVPIVPTVKGVPISPNSSIVSDKILEKKPEPVHAIPISSPQKIIKDIDISHVTPFVSDKIPEKQPEQISTIPVIPSTIKINTKLKSNKQSKVTKLKSNKHTKVTKLKSNKHLKGIKEKTKKIKMLNNAIQQNRTFNQPKFTNIIPL